MLMDIRISERPPGRLIGGVWGAEHPQANNNMGTDVKRLQVLFCNFFEWMSFSTRLCCNETRAKNENNWMQRLLPAYARISAAHLSSQCSLGHRTNQCRFHVTKMRLNCATLVQPLCCTAKKEQPSSVPHSLLL